MQLPRKKQPKTSESSNEDQPVAVPFDEPVAALLDQPVAVPQQLADIANISTANHNCATNSPPESEPHPPDQSIDNIHSSQLINMSLFIGEEFMDYITSSMEKIDI